MFIAICFSFGLVDGYNVDSKVRNIRKILNKNTNNNFLYFICTQVTTTVITQAGKEVQFE